MSTRRERHTVVTPVPSLDHALFETMVDFQRHPMRSGNIKIALSGVEAAYDEILHREEYIYKFDVEWEDPYK